jgi:hypothetical protein
MREMIGPMLIFAGSHALILFLALQMYVSGQ